jgi:hypothetical protein
VALLRRSTTITVRYDPRDYSIVSASWGAPWTGNKGERFADGVIYCIIGARCSSNVKRWEVSRDKVIRERTWEYRALLVGGRGTFYLTITRYGRRHIYIDYGYSENERYFNWRVLVDLLQTVIEIIGKT